MDFLSIRKNKIKQMLSGFTNHEEELQIAAQEADAIKMRKAKEDELKKAEGEDERASRATESGMEDERWITIRGRHLKISRETGEVKEGGQGMADGEDIEKIGKKNGGKGGKKGTIMSEKNRGEEETVEIIGPGEKSGQVEVKHSDGSTSIMDEGDINIKE